MGWNASHRQIDLFFVSIVGSAPFAAGLTHLLVVASHVQTLESFAVTTFAGSWTALSAYSYSVLRRANSRQFDNEQTASCHSKSVVLVVGLLCILALGTLIFARNPWRTGDGFAHRVIISNLSIPGPYSLSPFDHVDLNSGLPYPQAFHYLVKLFSALFRFENVTDVTLLILSIYGTLSLPLILYWYGRVHIHQEFSRSALFSLALVFSSALAYEVETGTYPSLLAVPSALFLATMNRAIDDKRLCFVTLIFGGLLLATIHPSGIASLLFLVDWGRMHPPRFPIHFAIIALILLAGASVYGYDLIVQFSREWFNSQQRSDFDPSIARALFSSPGVFLSMFTLGTSLFHLGSLAGLVGWWVLGIALWQKDLTALKALVAGCMLLFAHASGVSNFIGLLSGVPTIFWYSTPHRFDHVFVICLFQLVVKSIFSGSASPKHFRTAQVFFGGNQAWVLSLITILQVVWTASVSSDWLELPRQ